MMPEAVVEAVLAGNRRAIARLITQVENQEPDVYDLLARLFQHTGNAWVIGVTGAPGTGKSSLVNAMTAAYREQDKTVAVIAVDPSSPFSGGAILGDRIRMREHAGDRGVFIRSMASRGNTGGLALTTRDVVRVLDASGFDVIIVETVGAGQSEIDIVRSAYTTIVVEAPGLGDDVQAIKAGILEIADILVVNKADRVGARQTETALKMMLELGHPVAREAISHHSQSLLVASQPPDTAYSSWIPPLVQTVATKARGIDGLLAAIEQHRQHIQQHDKRAVFEQSAIEQELYERLQQKIMQNLKNTLSNEMLTVIIQQVQSRQLDPETAVHRLLSSYQSAQTQQTTEDQGG